MGDSESIVDTLEATSVRVVAPSRLHFGLFSFGDSGRRQYGGAGVMVDRPGLELRITAASRFCISGSLAPRVREFASRWAAWRGLTDQPCCNIQVVSAPRQHVGLGVGTQLGFAVAAGLDSWSGRPRGTIAEVAVALGRGKRSAIGTHGFFEGGFIVERGKLGDEAISQLDARVRLPRSWQFVLVTPRDAEGISGGRERLAFRQVQPVPAHVSAKLESEAYETMLPAAQQSQFDCFCESVHRFGRLAGTCFEEVQGGPYNGPRLQRLVEKMVDAGFRGVGQSSWGPTLFMLSPDQHTSDRLVARLEEWPELVDAEIMIAAPNHVGATVQRGH